MSPGQMSTNVKNAVRILADQAEELGADPSDSTGAVRSVVSANGFGFYAWFCVCCELADRDARRDGFCDQFERAASGMRPTVATGHT